ncbi:MAG: undecaprenyl/decaprenyl-phosphate alpha-N-acetylglucosaminyl 1-phosphate transferase, partial [Pirellulaceae bacterium]|nr:undecaprenyl/decaprenyl-phosphate alpha-N-acetylglucosaminyl 1-phosphate transferase [Pirellulaceae bacterium]
MNLESTIWFVGGAIMPSMLVAWLATFAARRLAPRWGLIDRPNERKVHLTPTPMGGGIGIAIGVLIPFLVGQVILIVAINSPAIGDLLPEFARPHLTGLLNRSA